MPLRQQGAKEPKTPDAPCPKPQASGYLCGSPPPAFALLLLTTFHSNSNKKPLPHLDSWRLHQHWSLCGMPSKPPSGRDNHSGPGRSGDHSQERKRLSLKGRSRRSESKGQRVIFEGYYASLFIVECKVGLGIAGLEPATIRLKAQCSTN
ncbi:hypothetical protein KY290_025751 [Solanum tuberosum]|uniref:Uncharacterized protein n=1 Tax=Solanum tuberosum TaxID=4113 RepID=A0ABQ7UWI4_SOLTU|nr:hypothetical protein KY289_024809 [Solanum tuberosum]KAH0676780.1 hypothetical protein KY285_024581 [Solanum tuberosum]KAH0755481.1 hypothetical protein KY290_025751 [Solanum tuberosum]